MKNKNDQLATNTCTLDDFISSGADGLDFEDDLMTDFEGPLPVATACENDIADPFVRDQLTQAYQTWQGWKRTDPEQLRREVGMIMTGKEVNDVNNQLEWLVDNYEFVKFLDDAIDETIGSPTALIN